MSIICKLPEIHETIERTKSPDWHVRLQALKEICPCRVLKDIDLLWDRGLEMAKSNEPNDTGMQLILNLPRYWTNRLLLYRCEARVEQPYYLICIAL